MSVPKGFTMAKVERRIDWTADVFSLRVTGASLSFEAGQYTKLALLSENGELVSRPYSIVNAPLNSSDMLEFLIVAHPEGVLSHRLQNLKEGDEIYVGERAHGDLIFRSIPKSTENLWLLATGTGIGPFLSLLDDINFRPSCENIVLVHAVRRERELVYQYLIEQLIQQYEGRLTYLPIVSREQIPNVLRGRIPQLLQQRTLQEKSGVALSPKDSFAMLCGNPDMIKETIAVLTESGLEKYRQATGGNILYERYW
ncbi:ferredoxin--NADP reductase [Vibrio japonicus]|uniref:ferredoxin--NADP(+) reductase n=1 Tax=Vibrio japonicus TaxID=1824638 RepID=A0ABY5LMR4_9VIBR|nr:ferredoxin--NADP reductase [Vibrio japonicus]UUM33121.1 ferredoxin--NADP reductase [Vibrio japonicus]